MWTGVELREIRAFLTLAEELHFARTAERLGLTNSRVSQTIRTLEARTGGRLFERSSRRVELTALGERLRDRITPGYEQIERAFNDVHEAAVGLTGALRIGMYTQVIGGPYMGEIVKAFRARHPNCEIVFLDTGLVRGQLDWLRSGEVDLLVMRLPFSSSDVTIGPVLSRDQRMLAVATDHSLAGRESIIYEELADYPVTDQRSLPREMLDAFIPPPTPSGKLLRRVEIATLAEALMQVAAGDTVHPTVRSLLEHGRAPGTTAVPILDLPPSETALTWLTANHSAKIDAFARTTADVLAHTELAPPEPLVRPATEGSEPNHSWQRLMCSSLELREIRVFLALAEELHFGRTAERLGITHPRVSQTIQTLEARIGTRLFDRTSRKVRATPIGEQLHSRIASSYEQLRRGWEDVHELATGVAGTLRLGTYAYVATGPQLIEVIKVFETRHPDCKVQVTETGLEPAQFDRLHHDQLDMIAMRMPLNDPDLTIGPTLTREPRVLVVATDHPLAALPSVSVEDLADYTTTDVTGAPREIMDTFSPPRTPSGKPIRRASLNSIPEAAVRAATGELVHPTVPSFLTTYQHPGLVGVPIRDLPPATTALVWARANHSVKIQAFAGAAADVVRLQHALIGEHTITATEPPPSQAFV
ncbi:MAG: LysR substrate-binding domain-containing protein [Solirubrobacteraceae bacterium]